MRSITELFEFLNHCDKETLLKELNDHCDRLVQKNGIKSIRLFKIDVENLNALFRLSEWYLSEELPRMIDEKNPNMGQGVLVLQVCPTMNSRFANYELQ
jgi:hypothetical protein